MNSRTKKPLKKHRAKTVNIEMLDKSEVSKSIDEGASSASQSGQDDLEFKNINLLESNMSK